MPEQDEGRIPDSIPVDESVDTTDGNRDPLTTDSGLAAAAEQMPETTTDLDADGDSEDSAQHRALQDNPDLDVTDDGTDPLHGRDELEHVVDTDPAGAPAPEVP